jgi:Cu+-exporting ATPase
MITGDHEVTASAVASELGITRVVSEVMPQDKAREVEKLQSEGPVAFVGDGINDAPSLAQADVGIALSTGQDIAMESADVVFVGGSLNKLITAIELARRSRAIILQNLWWALGYNVILIPLAAGALYLPLGLSIEPMVASAFMALSSVTVVLNSLRLRKPLVSFGSTV